MNILVVLFERNRKDKAVMKINSALAASSTYQKYYLYAGILILLYQVTAFLAIQFDKELNVIFYISDCSTCSDCRVINDS